MPTHVRTKDDERIFEAITKMGNYGAVALMRCESMAEAKKAARKAIPVSAIADFLEILAVEIVDLDRTEHQEAMELREIKAEFKCLYRLFERIGLLGEVKKEEGAPA